MVSIIVLGLLSPLFLLIGFLIIVDDPGPVFFKQKRVGRGGRVFTIFKFRTMRQEGRVMINSFEPGNTSRVTRTGRLLRKTKIDELPQFINVLIGNMSIVGPRPEVTKWVEFYPERWERILLLRPGITDMASIDFRNEEELLRESTDPENLYRDVILPKKLDYYEDYVLNNTVKGDFEIILKTFLTLFK